MKITVVVLICYEIMTVVNKYEYCHIKVPNYAEINMDRSLS